MEGYLWWIIIGMTLIIAELVSGTFFLLVLGLAAMGAAAAAYFGTSVWVQAVVAAAIATVGVVAVNRLRQGQPKSGGNSLDAGQSVVMEAWVNEKDRLARVRYRNASWDARVSGDAPADAGQVLYIESVDGNLLNVSKSRPV